MRLFVVKKAAEKKGPADTQGLLSLQIENWVNLPYAKQRSPNLLNYPESLSNRQAVCFGNQYNKNVPTRHTLEELSDQNIAD